MSRPTQLRLLLQDICMKVHVGRESRALFWRSPRVAQCARAGRTSSPHADQWGTGLSPLQKWSQFLWEKHLLVANAVLQAGTWRRLQGWEGGHLLVFCKVRLDFLPVSILPFYSLFNTFLSGVVDFLGVVNGLFSPHSHPHQILPIPFSQNAEGKKIPGRKLFWSHRHPSLHHFWLLWGEFFVV